MSDLSNKLTLVTGSSKGIGKAIAEAFIDKNARVVIHGRSRAELETVKESIGAFACVDGDLGTADGCDSVRGPWRLLRPVKELSPWWLFYAGRNDSTMAINRG